MLTEGRADLAAGTITVTEGRRALVDFSEHFHTQVREVLVAGPAAPQVKTAGDMLASKVYQPTRSGRHTPLPESPPRARQQSFILARRFVCHPTSG